VHRDCIGRKEPCWFNPDRHSAVTLVSASVRRAEVFSEQP
jgi:hypothetical protein